MKRKLKGDEITGIILFIISGVFLGISVFLCFSVDIWYDELFTMGLGNQSLGGLVSLTARDVHPPLYYMIVKAVFTAFNGLAGGVWQVAAAKLTSVVPFVLCFLYAATKIRKNFGLFPAGLFTFLLLSMPQLAEYTVEIRMYGFALFFITAGLLHSYEIMLDLQKEVHGRSYYVNWAAVTFYSLAACYTHYFACIAAVMIYAYLLACMVWQRRLKKEIKYLLLSGGVCAAGYLPWFIQVVLSQVGAVRDNYWIEALTLRSLGGCAKFIFMPEFTNGSLNVIIAVLLVAAYGIVLFFGFHKLLNDREEEGKGKISFALGCMGVLAGLVLMGFLLSFLIRPIFVYRYMLPALGAFWLAFALLLDRQKSRKYIFFPILFLFILTGLRNYRAFYGEEMWKNKNMAAAESTLADIGLMPEDKVVFNFDQAQGVITYYLTNSTYLWYGTPEELIREMYPGNHSLVEEEFSDEAGMAQIKSWLLEGESVWFFGSGASREEIVKKWKESGIEAGAPEEIMVERYWMNIYRLSLS